MNITKKIAFVAIFTLAIGFSVIYLLPKDIATIKDANCLRVGAGDDAGGLLLEQIKNISKNVKIDTITEEDLNNDEGLNLETLQFKDC